MTDPALQPLLEPLFQAGGRCSLNADTMNLRYLHTCVNTLR